MATEDFAREEDACAAADACIRSMLALEDAKALEEVAKDRANAVLVLEEVARWRRWYTKLMFAVCLW